eukprot:TRINITY_DN6047_c0_g1_i1.p1 TRINITY_DN6047_c0_g1~~TRINITY_DN6047_c0_g1_i1.p1  ORF type:complete len:1253 (-),score=340.59 TRINITY_DN6047_c0_g1_i1:55-3789(-)
MAAPVNPAGDFMSQFWDLAASDESLRLTAASRLLAILSTKTGDDQKQTLDYSLKRLVRGLASSRDGARQGFALALTELLVAVPSIPISSVSSLITEHLQVQANMKGQEKRHVYFGRIIAYLSVIRSKRIAEALQAASGKKGVPAPAAEAFVETMVKDFAELHAAKVYLRPLCASVLASLIESTPVAVFNKLVFPLLSAQVDVDPADAGPEAVALVAIIKRVYGPQAPPLKHWPSGRLLTAKSIAAIAPSLRETTVIHPQLHFVWDILIAELISGLKTADGPGMMQDFWRVVVDEGLFTSAPERKYLGFKLVVRLLPQLPAQHVPLVFTRNFMRCFITHLSDRKHLLHGAAFKVLDAFFEVASNDGRVCVALLGQLLGPHGSRQFDKLTSTRAITTLLTKLDEPGVIDYTNYLISSFVTIDASTTAADVETRRVWACDQLMQIARNSRIPHSDEWFLRLLRFFCVHGFFDIKSPSKSSKIAELATVPSPPVSTATHEMCAQKFFSLLGDLGTSVPSSKQQTGEKSEEHKRVSRDLIGTTNSGDLWAWEAAQIQQTIAASSNVKLVSEVDENVKAAVDAALNTVQTIRAKQQATKDRGERLQFSAFQLLFLHCALLSLHEPEDSIDTLNDVQECYKRVAGGKKKIATNIAKGPSEDAPIIVLTDVLLALLSRPSHALRDVVTSVFRAFSSFVTKDALQLLLNVLAPKEGPADGEAADAMEEDGDSADDDSDDNASSEEEDSTAKKHKHDDSHHDHHHHHAHGKKHAHSEEEEEEDDEESDDDSSDDSSEESDSKDLDDADDQEMEQMDAALSKVFSERKKAKVEQKETARQEQHFKFRVLDLLEIFVKSQAESPLMLDLVEPLLTASSTSAASGGVDKAIGERVAGIFKNKLCVSKEHPRGASVDIPETNALLERLVQRAVKATAGSVVLQCSTAILYVLRVLRSAQAAPAPKRGKAKKDEPTVNEYGGLDVEKFVAVFGGAWTAYLTRTNTHLNSAFFKELVQKQPHTAFLLAEAFIDGLSQGRTPFLRMEAVAVVALLLRQRAAAFGTDYSRLNSLASRLLPQLGALMTATAEDAKRVRNVLQCALLYVAELCKGHGGKLPETVDMAAIVTPAKTLAGSAQSPAVRSDAKRLLVLLKVQTPDEAPKQQKRKADDGADTKSDKKAKHKEHKSDDGSTKKQHKKEVKVEKAQAASEPKQQKRKGDDLAAAAAPATVASSNGSDSARKKHKHKRHSEDKGQKQKRQK